jgi:hypothetical protein
MSQNPEKPEESAENQKNPSIFRIDPDDHAALCDAVVRQTEIAGSECFEKNYIKDGRIVATVLCFVGQHAEEMTAMVREQLNHYGFHRDN